MSADLHYFDYAATTPADPRVITSMVNCLVIDGVFGNPASNSHAAGIKARGLVEKAREQVALLIGARADEIIWTSGATESNNLALKGFVEASGTVPHIVTSCMEHKAILDTAASLEQRGFQVTYVAPDQSGVITTAAVRAALRPDTGIVSLMLVNNEIGTITNIAAIAPIVHAAGALLHVDAAQALGKTPIDVKALGLISCRCPLTRSMGRRASGHCTSLVKLLPGLHLKCTGAGMKEVCAQGPWLLIRS